MAMRKSCLLLFRDEGKAEKAPRERAEKARVSLA
jgi:hypothetical protein